MKRNKNRVLCLLNIELNKLYIKKKHLLFLALFFENILIAKVRGSSLKYILIIKLKKIPKNMVIDVIYNIQKLEL